MREDALTAALWEPLLTSRVLGRGENRCLDTVDSTNTELKRMAAAGAVPGSLCVSEEQTAGRGRLGRHWQSPAGQGLWLSVLLRPSLPGEQTPLLTFAAALAMAEAVRETTELPVGLKWPNDLVCGGRKLCGILLEAVPEGIIVGTGLNLYPEAYPPELREQAVSLAELMPQPPRRREILARYLAALERNAQALEERGFAGIAPAYRALCATLGSPVRVNGEESFTGVAEEIDPTGALLVRDETGTLRRVLAGDVSVRGLMGYV